MSDEDTFFSSYPTLQVLGENLLFLNTTANISVTNDTDYLYEAAPMIQVKFKSRQAILEEISGENEDFEPTKFCRDINEVVCIPVLLGVLKVLYIFAKI